MTTYNTGNPIGSTEGKDLYDNAQNFDTLANTTTLETVPDRLGVPRMSLHGFEQESKRRFESIKFQPPIPYAPGIEVTTSSLTVDYLGVLYYPLPSALPFTTGAWNPAQWSPLQNTTPGHELLVFDDYASASAAAATLPDWQTIEVGIYRYTVQGGVLADQRPAEPLRPELAADDGASLVGYQDGTVAGELDRIRAQEGMVAGELDRIRALGSAKGTRLKAVLDNQSKDANILVQGDSTGNEPAEFVYLVAQRLAALYPAYSVRYRLWDTDASAWGAVESISAGTTDRVLTIYNGSIPGQTALYWHGAKKAAITALGVVFDQVITNFGLNTPEDQQYSAAVGQMANLRFDFPFSDIVAIIQNPDYNQVSRSQVRNDAQRRIFDEFGAIVVDSYTLFSELVRDSGGVAAWLPDGIHPNAQGQVILAEKVLAGMLTGQGQQRSLPSGPSPIPNAGFSRWGDGNAVAPTFWAVNAGTSVARTTSYYETQGQAVLVNGNGTAPAGTGFINLRADEIIARFNKAQRIVIAARVYTTGAGTYPGMLELVHTLSGAGVFITGGGNGNNGVAAGAFRWVALVVPQSFFNNKSDAAIRVWSGVAGESVVVDRVVISESYCFADSDGSESFQIEYVFNDVAVSVPANSSLNRNLTSYHFAKRGAYVSLDAADLPVNLAATVSTTSTGVTIRLTNPTAAAISLPATRFGLMVR